RHHECDEDCNQNSASERQKCRINQCLLHAISQVFCLHQMFHQTQQNLRQRAARLTSCHHVDVKWRENSRKLTQGLRETASVDQALMKCMRHLLDARLFQAFLQDRKSTRLNSSHVAISYAVFCLKKKKQ